MGKDISTRREEETEQLGFWLGCRLRPGMVLALRGALGVGKTVLARGIARGLGVMEPVTSPTFAIVQEYSGRDMRLYHMDMYRIQGEDDAAAFGLEEFLEDPESVSLIEWPERIEGLLPLDCIEISLTRTGATGRSLRIEQWPGPLLDWEPEPGRGN